MIADSDDDRFLDINGIWPSEYFLGRVIDFRRIDISYTPPAPARYIFSAEVLEDYNKIANYILRLKLATIVLNRNFRSATIDDTYKKKKQQESFSKTAPFCRHLNFLFLEVVSTE